MSLREARNETPATKIRGPEPTLALNELPATHRAYFMTNLTPPFGVEEVLRRLAIRLGVTLQNYLVTP